MCGLLFQENNLVTCVSKTFTPTERRYSTIERECLAVVYRIKRLRHYCCGRHFTVQTDHKPLVGIFENNSIGNARLERLRLAVSEFTFTVRYVKGDKMRAGRGIGLSLLRQQITHWPVR